ncbi:kinase-like protein [Lepidopterella palustris CBS 459.81]|uniref:non-specific serine/threonine protein kinase n=1 Tax=Lepidopterella palustris CBS 459.81 TaxID=1314670 RepID=A0A8E2EJD1_9PEZI|nr:kinase-like protein [Lepidopterella palustris CBS 459.81]
MADERQRSMSLVPYVSTESREVVLRHGSAVVVFDQRSKQLSLRDVSHSTDVEIADCPYCHRPLREDSLEADREEHAPGTEAEAGFVNPGYFRMLRRSQPGSTESSRPSSPHKRIGQIPLHHTDGDHRAPDGAEFVGSTPAPPRSQGISARAFSPNYFKTFFVEERELGRGGKGVVLLVRHILDGVPLGQFACKRVPVGDDHEWLEKVLIEVQLLQNLSHQNLVSYRHVWLEDYQISNFGPSVPCAFILQQYCNAGDLHQYILDSAKTSVTTQQLKERLRRRSRGQLDEPHDLGGPRRMHFEDILSFFKDITSGLNHLHANGYIHRDLKPSNCLLHNTGKKMRVLVSDFGEVQVANVVRKSTGATGTISYCAPEVLRRESPGGPLGNFSTKSDIFSLGMIVYFMCFGRLPYRNADGIDEDNEDLEQLREEISTWSGFDDERRARPDLPDKLYRSLKRLLSLDPAERPGTEEILQVFKSPVMFDEIGGYPVPSGIEELGPRISRADTPSPAPGLHARKKPSVNYTRPGSSKLKTTTLEPSRTPSPPFHSPAAAANGQSVSPPDNSVVLRPRKPELDSKPTSPRPLTPRLMLPPPPNMTSRFYQFLANPAVIGVVKVLLFITKVVSVSSPCYPFAAHPWVAYPLLCFAALDFTFVGFTYNGIHFGLGASVVLLIVHILIVSALIRWDALCLRNVAIWQSI